MSGRRLPDSLGDALGRWAFGASDIDYRAPAGDAGLYGPGSVTWRVHANPVALAIGGIAGVVLELAEPRVRSGVWTHSSFARDPLGRMRRTGAATLAVTYGPTAAAMARIAAVNRMHARVEGTTPEGAPYRALDPELLDWVLLTAGWGFLGAHRAYVEPAISDADQDRYFAEAARVGRLFGAAAPVLSRAQAEAAVSAMAPRLVDHPILREFLRLARVSSPLGPLGRPLQGLLVAAAIDLLPPGLAERLGLPREAGRIALARPLLQGLARAAASVPGGIPDQARARAASAAGG